MLTDDGYLHLDVPKYQHHGSEHNISDEIRSHGLGGPRRLLWRRLQHQPGTVSTSPAMQKPGDSQDRMLRVEQWAQQKKHQHAAHFDFPLLPFIVLGSISAAPSLNLADEFVSLIAVAVGASLSHFHEQAGTAVMVGTFASWLLSSIEKKARAVPVREGP